MTRIRSFFSHHIKLIPRLLLASILHFYLKERCSSCFVSSFTISVKKIRFQSLQSATQSIQSTKTFHSTRLFSSPSSILTKEVTKQCNEYENDRESSSQNVTLIPLSRQPLILTSSGPILSKEECEILTKECGSNNGNDENKEKILTKVKSIIDTLTNCPSHDGEIPPRLLIYDPVSISTDNDIIPDGLHVDVNNGKLFRHMTILLYLTDNDRNLGCATTFPIAVTIDKKLHNDKNHLIQAAKNLIDNKIYHTQSKEEKYQNDLNLLEQAAVNLYNLEQCKENERSNHFGIRVIPKAGSICVFYSLLDNGMPDPLSFHGGESCIGRDNHSGKANDGDDLSSESNKIVLSYFKEIPLTSFNSFEEFANNVYFSRKWLIDQYY